MAADASESTYPGERLGLPESGRGSMGRLGRRVAGILIDWGCAIVISVAFFSYDSIATLVVFVVVQIVFIPTIGGSPGQRIVGMRLLGPGGTWPGLWRPVVRTVLLALVIPAVVWDRDQRGLHDRVAGTVLVRA